MMEEDAAAHRASYIVGEEAMPKPFALIASSDIKAQAFCDVLRASGGVIEDARSLAGRLS